MAKATMQWTPEAEAAIKRVPFFIRKKVRSRVEKEAAAAAVPDVTDDPCTLCEACVHECRENAVSLDRETETPKIDFSRCVMCGQCARVCPAGTIVDGKTGFRIQVGGKLGRHPQLAVELPGLFSEDQVIEVVTTCINFYKTHSRNGQRLGDILKGSDLDHMFN